MAAPTVSNWRTTLVNTAVSILAAAIAVHVAAELVRSVAPELIGVAAAVAVCYVLVAINRYRRSQW